MSELSISRSILSDEQLLSLTYEDLCDAEYLGKILGDLMRGAPDESSDPPRERWMHTYHVPEDILNFGNNQTLGTQLFRRRVLADLHRIRGHPAHGDTLSKQTFIFGHMARVTQRLIAASTAAVKIPVSEPVPPAVDSILHLALLDALDRDCNAPNSAHRFECSLSSLIEVLRESPQPSQRTRLVVALGRRFAGSFAAARTSAGLRVLYRHVKLAAVCCAAIAKIGLQAGDSAVLLLALCQLLALRTRALALLQDEGAQQAQQSLSGKEDDDGGLLLDKLRLHRKISDAKLVKGASSAGSSGAAASELLGDREMLDDPPLQPPRAATSGRKNKPAADLEREAPASFVIGGKAAAVSSGGGGRNARTSLPSPLPASSSRDKDGKPTKPKAGMPSKQQTGSRGQGQLLPVAPCFEEAPGEEQRARRLLDAVLACSSLVPRDLLLLARQQQQQVDDGRDTVGLGLARGAVEELPPGSEVHSAGQNSYGELAHCDADQRRSFSRVAALDGRRVVSVGAGNEHSVFVTRDGQVVTAGYNDNGQCGVGACVQVRQPQTIAALADRERVRCAYVSNGCEHTLLVTHDGKLLAFGYNYRGQLGLGHTASEPAPKQVTALASHRIVLAGCSYHHSLALSSDGSLFAFGRNDFGQLGLGDTADRRLPMLVPLTEPLRNQTIVGVSCGQFHSVIVTSAGDAYCAGKNEYGQLMLESSSEGVARTFTAVPRPSSADSVKKAACGYYHTLLLTSSGAVYAAGRNDYGQCGLGSNQAKVFGLHRLAALADKCIVDVAAGCYHSVAASRSGMLYVFGRNNHGQLGCGDCEEKHAPFAVDAFLGRRVLGLSCGFYHSLVLSAGPAEDPDSSPAPRRTTIPFSYASAVAIGQQGRSTAGAADTEGADDFISFLIRRLETGTSSAPGGPADASSAPGERYLLHSQLSAASLLLNLSIELLVLPGHTAGSALHMLARDDVLLLLGKTLRTLKTLLATAGRLAVLQPDDEEEAAEFRIQNAPLLETPFTASLCAHAGALFGAEATEVGAEAVARQLRQVRTDLLALLHCCYADARLPLIEDLLLEAGAALACEALLPLLSPAHCSLIQALVTYIRDSLDDDVMLANADRSAHVLRCVVLCSRLLGRGFCSLRAATHLLQASVPAAVRLAELLFRFSADVFRLVRSPRLSRHFGDACVATLRAVLVDSLESYCTHCAKTVVASLLDPAEADVEAEAEAEAEAGEQRVAGALAVLRALFRAASSDLGTIASSQTHVTTRPTATATAAAAEGTEGSRALALGAVLPSCMPAVLLFGLNSTLQCGGRRSVVFAAMTLSEELLRELSAFRLPWAEKLSQLCTALATHCAGSLLSPAPPSSAAAVADTDIAQHELWYFLSYSESVLEPAELPVVLELDAEGTSDPTAALRGAVQRLDPGYRFLLSSMRRPSRRKIERIEWVVYEIAGLVVTGSLSSAPAQWISVDAWRAIAAFVRRLYAVRSSLPSERVWEEVLSDLVRMCEAARLLCRACRPRFLPSPLPSCRSQTPRLRRVLGLVVCALRWRRLANRRHAATVVLFFETLTGGFLALQQQQQQSGASTLVETYWSKVQAQLAVSHTHQIREVDALSLLSRFFEKSGSARAGILDLLLTIESGRHAQGCMQGKIADPAVFCSRPHQFEGGRVRDQLFNAVLPRSLCEEMTRALGRAEAGELRLLRGLLRAAVAASDINRFQQTQVAALLSTTGKLFTHLCDRAVEGPGAGLKGAQSRVHARELDKLTRGAAEALTLALLHWSLSARGGSAAAGKLLEVSSALLGHLDSTYFLQASRGGDAAGEEDLGRLLAGTGDTDGSGSAGRGVQKKRSQDIVTRPTAFSRDREGLVVQGDRLVTNFKGIDFTLSLWVLVSKRPADRFAFVAGKVSHTDAWPIVLLRAADNRLDVVFGKSADFERFTSKAALPANTWVHLCLVTEPRKIKLYVNGVLDSQASSLGNTRATLYPVVCGSCPVSVRSRVEHVREGFDGLLGGFTYHTRALSPAYARYLFEQGAPEAGDVREGWAYRLLTCAHHLLGRSSAEAAATPTALRRRLADLCLRLVYRASGRVRSLAASLLALLLERGLVRDVTVESSRDDKLALLGLEGAAACAVSEMACLHEADGFRERLILLLLRTVGCCWEPSVLSTFFGCDDKDFSRLNFAAAAGVGWSSYFVDAQLSEFVSYLPASLSGAVMCAVLHSYRQGSAQSSERELRGVEELGAVLTALLCRLGSHPSWQPALCSVLGASLERAQASVEARHGWRALTLLEALGSSAVLCGGGAALPLLPGARVSCSYSASPGLLLSVDASASQSSTVLLGGGEGGGALQLVSQHVGELCAGTSPAPPLTPEVLPRLVALLRALLPFVQLLAADLFAVSPTLAGHPFVASSLLRPLRPVEALLFRNALCYLSERTDVPAAAVGLVTKLALRIARVDGSARSGLQYHRELRAAWVRASPLSASTAGAPAVGCPVSDRQLADYLSKSLLVSTEGLRSDEQSAMLRAGEFAEFIFSIVHPTARGGGSVIPPSDLCYNDCGADLSEAETGDLFALASILRRDLIVLSRRIVATAAASALELDEADRHLSPSTVDAAYLPLVCQALATARVDSCSNSVSRLLLRAPEAGGALLPAVLRYTALSFFKSTLLRPADCIQETSDLVSRAVLAAHCWLDSCAADSLEGSCLLLLRVLFPSLSFLKQHSEVELQLVRLCVKALDLVLLRVFQQGNDDESEEEDTGNTAGATAGNTAGAMRELLDLARSNAFVQLRRRAQEAVLDERAHLATLSALSQGLVQLAAGLELLQRRLALRSACQCRHLLEEADKDVEEEEWEALLAERPSAPRVTAVSSSSVELELAPCPHPALLLEVALGVLTSAPAAGEDADFEVVYRGSGARVVEAGLVCSCSYSVRCRLVCAAVPRISNHKNTTPSSTRPPSRLVSAWSPTADFATSPGTPFVFSASHCGPDIVLSNEGRTASYSGDDSWSTVLGSRPFSCGVVSWEMRVVQSSTAYIFVGVAKSTSDLNTFLGGDEHGWGFIGEQALYHSREKVQVYGESFSRGDVVGVALDLTAGTLAFSRNGKTLGVGFTNVFGELYPAVAFYNVGQEIELLPEGFRCSVPHEPSGLSPSLLRPDDTCLLLEALYCLTTTTTSNTTAATSSHSHSQRGGGGGMSRYLAEQAAASCNEWLGGEQVRRDAVSGSRLLIAGRAALLDACELRAGDRVRTPLGLAAVIGAGGGRLWLQMGEARVWFFSRQQVLQGQEQGLFLRASYQTPSSAGEEKKTGELSASADYVFDTQGFLEAAEGGWTAALDAELMRALSRQADLQRVTLWELTAEDLRRDFRVLQQPLGRLAMRDPALYRAWGLKGPGRRAVLARVGLLRFVNHLLQRNLAAFCLDDHDQDTASTPMSISSGGSEGALSGESVPVITTLSRANQQPRLATLGGDTRHSSSQRFSLPAIRQLIFRETKFVYFGEMLQRSAFRAARTEDEYDYPEELPQVKLSRFRSFCALELAGQSQGVGGEELLFASMFCQLWRELRGRPTERLRIHYTHPMDDGQTRAFKVRFEGEGVDDYGGPYRDVFQCVCEELQRLHPARADNGTALDHDHTQTCFIPLLCPTRNWGAADCEERYKFTFSPAQTSALSLELFGFLGQFVGLGLRSKITLDLALTSSLWKAVVREPLGEDDIQAFDAPFHRFAQHLRELLKRLKEAQAATTEAVSGVSAASSSSVAGELEAAAEALLQDLTWSAVCVDGSVHDLVPGGRDRRVALGDANEYLRLATNARLRESAAAVDAFRGGLLAVVPAEALALLSWFELESLVCGSREVDVRRLQENTEYDDDVTAQDQHILFFWETLAEFSEADKSRFLRFVWARPTLPPRGAPFTQKMRIQSVLEEGGCPVDAYLPKAHTCFFSLNLPRYSSQQVMREKLRYAIFNCTEMDADYKLTDSDDVAGWNP